MSMVEGESEFEGLIENEVVGRHLIFRVETRMLWLRYLNIATDPHGQKTTEHMMDVHFFYHETQQISLLGVFVFVAQHTWNKTNDNGYLYIYQHFINKYFEDGINISVIFLLHNTTQFLPLFSEGWFFLCKSWTTQLCLLCTGHSPYTLVRM